MHQGLAAGRRQLCIVHTCMALFLMCDWQQSIPLNLANPCQMVNSFKERLEHERHGLCALTWFTMCSRLLSQEAIAMAALGQIRCVSCSSCCRL